MTLARDTKTAPEEEFDYYVGPLNVDRLDHYSGPLFAVNVGSYDELPPADVWVRNAPRGIPFVVNNHGYAAFTASEPAPLPLGALISGRHVIAGASASLLSAGRLIAIAAGQLGNRDFTVIPLTADDVPVRDRIAEISGARRQVEARLDSISGLSNGWLDGEGVTPTEGAIVAARRLIWLLLIHGADRPRLAPTPEGGVEAEWTAGAREVSVIFEPDGSVYGCAVDVTTGHVSERELSPDDHQAVADFVLGRA
jgi:hypothetical protein